MRASIALATWVNPCKRYAACAIAAKVEMPIIGRSAPKAKPCAIPMPIRTPVKLPGPRPKAKASNSCSVTPASFKTSSTIGNTFLV
ncbi:Uncharacterised protein [Vibrio cholerae]|nr:Uncharacterised protein [Vibrio cholerae]